MRKILITILILMLVCAYFKPTESTPIYVSPRQQISKPPNKRPKLQPEPIIEADHEAIAMVKRLNKINEHTRNLTCEQVIIRFKHKLTVRLTADLYYEKDKNFRMKISSLLGKEMDLGSNDQRFWFWSRHMDPPALYHARHEDIHKTLLKTPLNPVWMMESLSLGEIDLKNVEVVKFKDMWAILQPRISSTGENITKMTLIDPKQEEIAGHYLYNSKGKLIASTEIQQYQRIDGQTIPKKVLIIWYDENVVMEWDLKSPTINRTINPTHWTMPQMSEMIDMGK
jgi:hypothetical protein